MVGFRDLVGTGIAPVSKKLLLNTKSHTDICENEKICFFENHINGYLVNGNLVSGGLPVLQIGF